MIDFILKKSTRIETGIIEGNNVARLLSGKKIKFFGRTSQFDIGKVARFVSANGKYTLLSIENNNDSKVETYYI